VLDEASPSEYIKLMGTGKIIPSEELAEEEILRGTGRRGKIIPSEELAEVETVDVRFDETNGSQMC